MGATLADGGVNPSHRRAGRRRDTCRHTLAVMATAGLYETSGDWLYDVGLPGKSGIGGGIVTVAPGKGPGWDVLAASRRGREQRQGAARGAVPLEARSGLDIFLSSPAPRDRTTPRWPHSRSLALACLSRRRRRPRRRDRARGASAPVVRLVEQLEECGHGEPYRPTDVDLLFDEPTVALRGPWNPVDLVKVGPTAADLAGLYEYHLDFPGNALDPGCSYERWDRRLPRGHEPAVYPHVATDPAHPGSWRSSTGSSTPTTTGTTCTRATGR